MPKLKGTNELKTHYHRTEQEHNMERKTRRKTCLDIVIRGREDRSRKKKSQDLVSYIPASQAVSNPLPPMPCDGLSQAFCDLDGKAAS